MRRLYVLDFDRTLGDTNALNDALIRLVGTMYPGLEKELLGQVQAAERDGASFVTLDAVQNLLEPEEYAQLCEKFLESQKDDEYLLPGAKALLEYIATNGYDVRIVSYGEPVWQELKLRASGLADSVPFLIVPNPSKSATVLEWRQDDGTFIVPGAEQPRPYDEVVIVDDKARAFGVWDEGLVGYWVNSGGELLPSQQGEVPEGVRTARSLQEVIASEAARSA